MPSIPFRLYRLYELKEIDSGDSPVRKAAVVCSPSQTSSPSFGVHREIVMVRCDCATWMKAEGWFLQPAMDNGKIFLNLQRTYKFPDIPDTLFFTKCLNAFRYMYACSRINIICRPNLDSTCAGNQEFYRIFGCNNTTNSEDRNLYHARRFVHFCKSDRFDCRPGKPSCYR